MAADREEEGEWPWKRDKFSFVAGGNGFIGSHVTRCLTERWDKVRVLVRRQLDLRASDGLLTEVFLAHQQYADYLTEAIHGVQRRCHVAVDIGYEPYSPDDMRR